MTQEQQTWDTFNPFGGNAATDGPKKVTAGMTLVDSAGRQLYVTGVTDKGPRVTVLGSANSLTDTAQAFNLPGGMYRMSGFNSAVQVDGAGNIAYQGAPLTAPKTATGEYRQDAAGTVYRIMSDGSEESLSPSEANALFGDGGTGSSGTLYGTRAPDPAGAISAILDQYKLDLADTLRPREWAKEEFDRRLNLFEAMQNGEINYGTFLQNAAITEAQLEEGRNSQLINIEKYKEDQALSREEARTTRGQNIADTRRLMGQSFVQDFMPTMLPGEITGLNIPGFGNMPTNRMNPDQIYGTNTLNMIPDIGATSTANYPTIAPVPSIPVPNVSMPPADMYTPLPTPQTPQIPDLSGFINAIASGSRGWYG